MFQLLLKSLLWHLAAVPPQEASRFISQDKYLSGRRGQYSERYGALSPWRGKWDMKFMQDYNFKVSGNKTNTIQFSIDVLNIGNFLNSDWEFKFLQVCSQLVFL
jgi:hypothetical protein